MFHKGQLVKLTNSDYINGIELFYFGTFAKDKEDYAYLHYNRLNIDFPEKGINIYYLNISPITEQDVNKLIENNKNIPASKYASLFQILFFNIQNTNDITEREKCEDIFYNLYIFLIHLKHDYHSILNDLLKKFNLNFFDKHFFQFIMDMITQYDNYLIK